MTKFKGENALLCRKKRRSLCLTGDLLFRVLEFIGCRSSLGVFIGAGNEKTD